MVFYDKGLNYTKKLTLLTLHLCFSTEEMLSPPFFHCEFIRYQTKKRHTCTCNMDDNLVDYTYEDSDANSSANVSV